MKRFISFSFILLTFMCLSLVSVSAQTDETMDYEEINENLCNSLDIQQLYLSLPDETKDVLKIMGVADAGPATLENVTFFSIMNGVGNSVKTQGANVLKTFSVITAVIFIYALFDGFTQSLTGDTLKEVLSVVCALCLACALVIPVTSVINESATVIATATNFMLCYVPVMCAVLVTCGKSLSSSGYYALMIGAAELISQLCHKVITPMLNVFLGVSICSSVVPQINLNGITSFFAKTVKWLLSFTFTIFSALLTFRTLISTSVDTVSTRAVRYTVSSFVPIVGTALAEAYKTVQGSVNILKNGMGVFVIFAVGAVFLPVIVKLLLWSFSVNLCKSISQVINLSLPVQMLSGVSTVLSVLFAVNICIMALYIISTALIITAGGNAM